MFYIDTIHKDRRDVLFLHILPTVIVFFAFLIATLFSWSGARRDVSLEQQRQTDRFLQENTAIIRDRMSAYENILRTGASIFNFSDVITKEEWKAYVATLDIENRYPGVQGIGFAQVIAKNQLNSHINQMKEAGYDDYSIEPRGERDLYTSVVFIEPFTERNAPILGYDMYADSTRKAAMDAASKSGAAAITDRVTLRQDINTPERAQPGFIIYVPTQKNVLTTRTENGQMPKGFVYAPFRAQNFIEKNVSPPGAGIGFELVHIKADGEESLYQSTRAEELGKSDSSVKRFTNIQILGAQWELRAYSSVETVDAATRSRPFITLLSGIFFSIVIAGFIYLLITNRTRALSEKEQAGIQEAKDELLALASHQLRTPATGVKQYIGMLRDGLAGMLNDTQKMLIEKAYESNERQLSTINEMLFVARADAGQLKMDGDRYDFVSITKEVIDELKPMMQKRRQHIHIDIRRKHIYTTGDKTYIRMAIENLLSNASKYTHEGGKISVNLRVRDNVIALRVTDTGVGVSEKDHPLLFKKFSRIPNELTSSVSGSGIGLYLTKRIIDAHNGRIIFKSIPNKGSEVTILVPINEKPSSKLTHRETFLHRPVRSTSQD